jgi:hypothetical protein
MVMCVEPQRNRRLMRSSTVPSSGMNNQCWSAASTAGLIYHKYKAVEYIIGATTQCYGFKQKREEVRLAQLAASEDVQNLGM